ncbi:TonB-dependent receptor [Azospirillum sp. B4]|uniref:TonB-dependent receptor n=1 Tax=Azospirillum sp. B4 TaxID=95605 RepID=UPI000678FDC3|nr:TonB-dependent receptor [Azospirillum sp. B4]
MANFNMRMRTATSLLALLIAGATSSAYAQISTAATPPAPQAAAADTAGADELTEIVVTARKTGEDILKTPVAVSALTAEDIAARGIVSVQDISAFTPGMKVVNSSAGRNDRSFQQVIIRGFTPSNALSQTTSIFLDGVPVSSATAISNVTDPERVEVLKGPQSAYFGRQTFAGAVNVITRDPNTDDWGGSISGMLGTRNNRDFQAELSGPIVSDKLGIRVEAREFAKDGSYTNAGVPGQTLGDQETRSGSVALKFTPSEHFTAKFYGMITADDDGPSAQGLISAYTITGASGNVVVPSQSNCTLNGVTALGVAVKNAYICGTAPKLIGSPSANTANDAFIKTFLANPTSRLIDPGDGVQGYGLVSQYYHLHLAMDYEVPETNLVISSLTGYNHEYYSELADLDNYYDTTQTNPYGGTGSRSYFDYPYLVERKNEDVSQELRATYNQGPFRGTLGASFLDAKSQNALGGGNGALGVTSFSTINGMTRSKTVGVFYGLSYQLTDALTVSVDGRYQVDHLYAYAPPSGLTVKSNAFLPIDTYAGGAQIASHEYQSFLPRAIIQYDVTPDTMVYASYSEGVNPGAFNTAFLSGTALVQQTAAANGYKIEVEPEQIDNYEIGIKGKLFDNRVRYTIDAYRAVWKNQINNAAMLIFDPSTGSSQSVNATLNAGRVKMTGVEGDITAVLAHGLQLNVSGAINDSYIEKLVSPSVTQMTGVTDFTGKEDPLTSKYSAAIGLQYTHDLDLIAGSSAYVRGDFTYKSGVWSDAANILRSPDLTNVNLRLGLNTKTISAEFFRDQLVRQPQLYECH